jgi:hypothetical protein
MTSFSRSALVLAREAENRNKDSLTEIQRNPINMITVNVSIGLMHRDPKYRERMFPNFVDQTSLSFSAGEMPSKHSLFSDFPPLISLRYAILKISKKI